jgi:hypothetical protein
MAVSEAFMSTATMEKALLPAPARPSNPATMTIVRVAKEFGVNPFRQFAQIIALQRRRNGVGGDEYYSMQMFRPDLTAAQRREFVGQKGNLRLNMSLTSKEAPGIRGILGDKIMLGALLRQFGLRTTETQAIVNRIRGFGMLPVLRSADDIEAFLRDDARYPLFAKPSGGSLSVGSALISEFDRQAGQLRLANGASFELSVFAREVFEDHGNGFLFQTAVAQHPEITRMAGTALATVRVVTVMEEAGPRVLYAVWKLPSPQAMSDSSWQEGNMLAAIDIDSGTVQQCRRGSGPDAETVETHGVSGLHLPGFQLPHWPQVLKAAEAAHGLFPSMGILGWDVGLSAEGPVILEANDNPFHMLYQRAYGRGILNPEFAPVFEAIRNRVVKAEKARKQVTKRRLKRR